MSDSRLIRHIPITLGAEPVPARARLRAVLLTATTAVLSSSAVVLPTSPAAAAADVLTYEGPAQGVSGVVTAPSVSHTTTTLTFSGEATAPGQSYARGFAVWFDHAPGSLPEGSFTWPAGDTSAPVRAGTYYLGCFDPAGHVQVHESQLQPDGSVSVFAATYTLSCPDGSSAGGEVRWRSTLAYAAAEGAPGLLDAGKREVGSVSQHTATVRNRGTTGLRTGAPALSGDGAASWSVAATTCGGLLPPAGSCTVGLTARPDARGTRPAILRVPVDSPGGAVHVPLGVFGIVRPQAPATVTVAAGVGRAQVRWSQVGDPDTTVTGYTVYRSVAGAPRTRIASVSGLRYDDLAVQQGQLYVYSVDAVNELGPGLAKAAAGVRIPGRELVWGGSSGTWRRGAPGAPALLDGVDANWRTRVGTPAFSPDGRQMAYWADIPGAPGLYVAAADGRGARRIAPYLPLGYGVSWSADGRTLLYLRGTGSGVSTLYALPAAGGSERAVTSGPELVEVTAYDARTALLTVHDTTGRALVRLDLVTGARSRLTGSDGALGRAALSPDGRTIAYTHLDWVEPDGARLGQTSVRLLPVGGGSPRIVPTALRLPTVLEWTGPGRSLLVQFLGSDGVGEAQRVAELPVDGSPPVDWGTTPAAASGAPTQRYADVTPPVVTLVGAARAAVAPTVTTTWRGADPSGVVSYDVRTRRARHDGDYGAATSSAGMLATTSTSTAIAAAAGYDTCVDVRARDGAGRTSAWVGRCTARPMDDRALVASRGWSRLVSSGSYGGTVSTTRTAGATLSVSKVAMARGYLVATRCVGCGSVEVRVAGRLLGTVSLAATTTQRQVLIPLPGAGTTQVGQLVLRATSSRPVHVDGLAVGRS